MNTVRLDAQAAAFLKNVQHQTGVVPASVDAALGAHATPALPAAAQTAGAAVAAPVLTLSDVEKIVLAALPEKKQLIAQAKQEALQYHPDKTNGRFLTQILSMRIEKEEDFVVHNPAPPVRRDPLYASFTLDPKADVMLLFNARDVDRDGKPLLMKVVARERADLSQLDLTRYRTMPQHQPDVVKVANDASYVETKDIHEEEFSFGDPLKQVSLNAKSQEISTSVWVRPENKNSRYAYGAMRNPAGQIVPNPNARQANLDQITTGESLDTQRVVTFDDRVRLSLKAKDTLPAGVWLDTPNIGDHVEVGLHVDRGFMFEPGSAAVVAFEGQKLDLSVPKDDAQLLGSLSASTVVPSRRNTLRALLSQAVSTSVWANPTKADRHDVTRPAREMLFANADSLEVAGATFTPLADLPLDRSKFAAAKVRLDAQPLVDDDDDGAKVRLTLDDGFLNAADGHSVKGFKLVVGYTDETGTWIEGKARTVDAHNSSKKESFTFDAGDFDALQQKNIQLEVRVFNADGIPAQRVLLPFRDVAWAQEQA